MIAAGEGGDELEEDSGVLSHAWDLGEGLGQGVQHAGQGAEPVQQSVGQRIHISLRDGVAEQQLQELVVMEAVSVGEELGLEPLAVAVVESHGCRTSFSAQWRTALRRSRRGGG